LPADHAGGSSALEELAMLWHQERAPEALALVCPRPGRTGEEASYNATVCLLDTLLCSQVQRYLTV